MKGRDRTRNPIRLDAREAEISEKNRALSECKKVGRGGEARLAVVSQKSHKREKETRTRDNEKSLKLTRRATGRVAAEGPRVTYTRTINDVNYGHLRE